MNFEHTVHKRKNDLPSGCLHLYSISRYL